jgi:hypothetical protein
MVFYTTPLSCSRDNLFLGIYIIEKMITTPDLEKTLDSKKIKRRYETLENVTN